MLWGMFVNVLLSLIIAFTVSPIWPLGENPLVGNPFIIVNKETNQLAFIDDGEIQGIYPVATGVTSELTPEGKFDIIIKAKDPYYRRKNIVGGSPDNPLGTRWIGFNANGTDGRIYGIHGTNHEWSIGKYISNGCIRLKNSEVENLYDRIPIGTKIVIVKTNKSFLQIGIENEAIKK